MRRVVTIGEQGAIEQCFHMDVVPVTVFLEGENDLRGQAVRLDFHRCRDCERTWFHDKIRGGWNEVVA
jgi:hypothetical protein